MRLRLSVLLASILLEAVPAAALTPHLVKDINSIPISTGSKPEGYVAVGKVAFFTAIDSLSGRELYRTDGTPAGTFQVVDACPGPCIGGPGFVAQNGKSYFFTASSGEHSRELWVSGGLPANTFRLTDPLRFAGQGIWSVWMASQSVLYFAADDGIHGMELWRTDGTRAGTHLAVDIRPGPAGSDPNELTDFAGRLFFRADDGQRGPSLWKSDGTAAGTQPVRDPIQGSAVHTGPAFLRVAGRTLFFVAPVKSRGFQLWKSDGTTAGTAALTNTRFSPSRPFLDFAVFGHRLMFLAADPKKGQELWISDATAGGTRPLTNLPKADAFVHVLDYADLPLPRFSLGNRFLFRADDGPHGAELWTTDGTPKGTRMIQDLCPGTCWGVGFSDPVALGGRAFFTGSDGLHGYEPWSTDGTAAGTRMIRDLCSGEICSSPVQWKAGKGKVFFVRQNDTGPFVPQLWSTDGTSTGTVRLTSYAWSGVSTDNLHSTLLNGSLLFTAGDPAYGSEPWMSDGTPQGTRLAADINVTNVGGSSPRDLKSAGGKTYFLARDGQHDSDALWVSDGTEAGTSFLLEPFAGEPFGPSSRPYLAAAAEAGGRAFLIIGVPALFPGNLDLFSLWRSDGTPGGTVRLTPESVQINWFEPMAVVGNQVFFVARDEIHDEELWVSDGTPEGTRMVVDLQAANPDYPGSYPSNLEAFQGRLYFSATVGQADRELWSSDGTPGGTVLVKDLWPLYGSEPRLLAEHAGRLYFTAFDEQGQKLWSTDGTAAGTLPVDLTAGPENLVPGFMVSAGSRFFLWGGTYAPNGPANSDYGLWVSDGTAAGTRRLGDGAIEDPREIARPIVFNGEVYFGSTSGVLWKSDGTAAGTQRLLTREGHEIRYPLSFRAFAGRLYFTTYHGQGLYESDGTQAGTRQLLHLIGPANVNLFELAPAGSRLLFQNWDRDHGFELWGLE
jgi:ELWxxDGT repeat protein